MKNLIRTLTQTQSSWPPLALRLTVGIRADTLHEQHGLDYTEHADIGYPEFQSSRPGQL